MHEEEDEILFWADEQSAALINHVCNRRMIQIVADLKPYLNSLIKILQSKWKNIGINSFEIQISKMNLPKKYFNL